MGVLVDKNYAKSDSELGNILQYDSNKNGCTSHLKLCQKALRSQMAHFSKKWLCPREKFFQWEKIFKIDIFVLKYVLNHSKSIPTKKFFSKIFDFLVIFWVKNHVFAIFQFFQLTRQKVQQKKVDQNFIAVILSYHGGLQLEK